MFVRGYAAAVDPVAVGLGILAFVFVRSDIRLGTDRVGQLLTKAPEVLEVHNVAGEDCFLVKVRAVDTEDLSRILRKRFGGIKAIRSIRTISVLNTSKESTAFPLPDPAKAPGDA